MHEKFLLIRALGHGFWREINFVLGNLLFSEIDGLIPVIYWGRNSLYSDGTDANAFELYFEKVSDFTIKDLQANSKQVAVIKPNVGVVNLIPRIPVGHHLYGLSVHEVYRYLVNRYLHPKNEILNGVDDFYRRYLKSQEFIAVHVRGSDKVFEQPKLPEINKSYKSKIDHYLKSHNCDRVFLMTDDSRILNEFLAMYGKQIISTNCQRTDNERGIHWWYPGADKHRLGNEVMKDAYLAVRAKAFIGNIFSGVSMIQYLKDWPDGSVYLFGAKNKSRPQ